MSFAFFWIPALDAAGAQHELNGFLRGHRVLALERHFVPDGPRSAWAISVDYAEGTSAERGVEPHRGKVDYRDVLDPPSFALFAAMRVCRKGIAEHEGVPAYAIATNEQMAQIARMRAQSLDDLKAIEGFGESRIRKYGRSLLDGMKAVQGVDGLRAAAAPDAGGARPNTAQNGE